jgi:prephenate dehydrogenase
MARSCDVVVISVPILETIRVIREIGALVPETGLLMDLTSVKKGPLEAMLKYCRGEVVGIHPLFGPESVSEQGLGVALCPGRGERGLRSVQGLFREAGFRVTVLPAEEHDQLMGIVQGVNHLSTLALALTMGRSGLDLAQVENLCTQSFRQRLDRIRTMLNQSESLFRSLLMENPRVAEFLDLHLMSVQELRRVIVDRDRKAFEEVFEKLRDLFASP